LSDHAKAASLASLGWLDFFADQLAPGDAGFEPMRISSVHRARLGAISQAGPVKLKISAHTNTGDFAVGDWVLVEPN
jgi:ribosome biogenesis GTPase